MVSQPLISIIVPVYNVEKYLERCLTSIETQTYKNLEIILVDDGSTDQCPKICDAYAQMDPRFHVIHKKNGGLVSARKAAMPFTHGGFIGYVDSDDYIEQGMFEFMLSNIQQTQSDIMITAHFEEYPTYSVFAGNNIEEGTYEGSRLETQVYSRILYDETIKRWPFAANCWNKLFRRSIVYSRQMDVDENITDGEDHAFVFPAMLDATRITFSDKAFYHHVIRDDSVSLAIKPEILTHYVSLQNFLLSVFSNSPYWKKYLQKQLPLHMWCFMWKYLNGMFNEEIINNLLSIQYLFPFQDVEKNSKIILYGAGEVGRYFYHQIQKSGYCKLVAWLAKSTSREYEEIVQRPENIEYFNYDYVVVAVKTKETADSIIMDLLSFGVDRNKIVWEDPIINDRI